MMIPLTPGRTRHAGRHLLAACATFAMTSGAVHAAPPLSALLDRFLVASPYKVPARLRAGEIRYRLAFDDARTWAWPGTGEQRIVQRLPGSVDLAVCTTCGNEPAPSASTLARMLTPNAIVRSDAPAVLAFARRHGTGATVDVRMRRLSAAVRAHMDGAIEYDRFDDADTALRRRSGDCTETAVLLAATARARGIPARIAYGVAYASRFTGARHVFSPHAWVQAWDADAGRWRSYDAGLSAFDAGHVALWTGDVTRPETPGVMPAIAHLEIVSMAGVSPER